MTDEIHDLSPDLSGVAGLVRLADPARLGALPVEPRPELEDLVVARVAVERAGGVTTISSRRRRSPWLVPAALGVAAAVVVALLLVAGGDDDGGDAVAFTVVPPGADASFELQELSWGTEIHLEVEGLEPGAPYWLWLTDDSGERTSAGTFRGSADQGSLTFTSGLPTDDAVRIWVTDADDQVVLDADLA